MLHQVSPEKQERKILRDKQIMKHFWNILTQLDLLIWCRKKLYNIVEN